MSHALLEVRGLSTWFDTPHGVAKAVDGVDLTLARGETLALVGESGSGKSVTAMSLLRLVAPPGRIVAGEVRLAGTDLLSLDAAALRRVRGGRIGIVFQDLSSLNPVERIGTQIAEAVRLHAPTLTRRQARTRAIELLAQVRMPSPSERAEEVPHRLSGGMRQRALIALALAGEPELLIADEPTTALDVTTQAQILALLAELQRERGLGLLLITHDLGVVAEVADRAAVMYAGRIVEEGPVGRLFAAPRHPYTAGLLGAVALDGVAPRTRLPEIGGTAPSLVALPAGCSFAPRCGRASAPCTVQRPSLAVIGEPILLADTPLLAATTVSGRGATPSTSAGCRVTTPPAGSRRGTVADAALRVSTAAVGEVGDSTIAIAAIRHIQPDDAVLRSMPIADAGRVACHRPIVVGQAPAAVDAHLLPRQERQAA